MLGLALRAAVVPGRWGSGCAFLGDLLRGLQTCGWGIATSSAPEEFRTSMAEMSCGLIEVEAGMVSVVA